MESSRHASWASAPCGSGHARESRGGVTWGHLPRSQALLLHLEVRDTMWSVGPRGATGHMGHMGHMGHNMLHAHGPQHVTCTCTCHMHMYMCMHMLLMLSRGTCARARAAGPEEAEGGDADAEGSPGQGVQARG
eukprot:6412142-Prymnesium_polylepis.2